MSRQLMRAVVFIGLANRFCGVQGFGADTPMKKWFPGHYLKIRHYDGPIQEDARELIKDNPYFAGYKIHVVWSELEPEKDRYDFSVVRAALEMAGRDGKKLMIHIQDRVFGRERSPYLPSYLNSDLYEGGWFFDGNKSLGRAWLPAYRQRWTNMLRQLGEETDSHPALAAIMLSESSGLFATKNMPPSWSLDGIMDFARETFATMTHSFPSTPFFQYVNWGLGPETRDLFMKELVEINRHGFGGPDIYDAKHPEKYKTWTLDMAFGGYYDKYRGIAPLCVENQNAGYRSKGGPQEVFDYAVDKIGVHFLPWTPVFSGGNWTIHDAIEVVNREKGRINAEPPRNIDGVAALRK